MNLADQQLSNEVDQQKCWIWVGVLLVIVAACYGNSILATAQAWDLPMYNHGYLIPIFAAFLIRFRAKPFTKPSSGELWFAAGLLTFATLGRVLSSFLTNFTGDRISMLIAVMAVFTFVGGIKALKWSAPAIAFMVFMFPWPKFFTDNIMRPMQTFATIISAYALQTMGIDAYRDGNRIMLEHAPMNVAEQCSGLRMLTIFIALSIAMAMISTHRPLWERVVIVVSSVPIALIVNSIRITLTGFLLNLGVGGEEFHRIFHDFAGWIMMPMALGLLFLEMHLLSRLVIEEEGGAPALHSGLG